MPGDAVAAEKETRESIPSVSVPSWLREPIAATPPRTLAIKPSGDDPVGTDGLRSAPARQRAIARGVIVHRLLQSLPDIPRESRAKVMEAFLARAGAELDAAEQSSIAKQVMLILEDPRFSELFAPGSRAEVPVVGWVESGGKKIRVPGQVDRLAVTQDFVLIGDFKTTRQPPRQFEDVPEAYVRQLVLYRAVLAQLYPDRPVRAALIWTDVPDLMELSEADMDAAFTRVTSA